ncbi:hypothetical protein [Actinophytocola sp.]|uniref:hypothetical protein n=1 Tax=Actinophytocola sp. TaxID=1872138 RepID=UPI00389B2690
MVRRGVLWWSLILAVVGGGVAVVVIAALWGGTPLREMPLIVTSMLIGGFLPPSVTAIYRRSGQVPRPRISQTAESSRATRPLGVRASDAVEFVSEPRGSEAGFKLFVGVLGLFLGGSGVAMIVSPAARASMFAGSHTPGVLTALPLAGFTLLMALLSLLFAFSKDDSRRIMVLSSAGTTITFEKSKVDISWTDVSDIVVKDDHLLFQVPALPKATAVLVNSTVSSGEGREFRDSLWSPGSPMIAVCKLGTLTVGSELLLKEIERRSGRKIVSC